MYCAARRNSLDVDLHPLLGENEWVGLRGDDDIQGFPELLAGILRERMFMYALGCERNTRTHVKKSSSVEPRVYPPESILHRRQFSILILRVLLEDIDQWHLAFSGVRWQSRSIDGQ